MSKTYRVHVVRILITEVAAQHIIESQANSTWITKEHRTHKAQARNNEGFTYIESTRAETLHQLHKTHSKRLRGGDQDRVAAPTY
jgi:hypothetical protein